MNERIKELAEQAWVYQMRVYETDGVRTFGEREQVFDKEKFAELIVDQMLAITDAHNEVFQTDRDKALIEHIKQSVKQHFGVEE